MSSIDRAEQQILSTYGNHSPSTRLLADLLDSLKSGREFNLHRLYEMSHGDFTLAVELLADWRLQRYVHQSHPSHRTDPFQQAGHATH